jgi:hypothetical protein
MEYRWILNNQRDGQLVTEKLSDRLIRLRREWWEHDCLDIDPVSLAAIHRSQGDVKSEDPTDWLARPCSLRMRNRAWEMKIEKEDWERWVSDQEVALRQALKYAASAPGAVAEEHVVNAQNRIDELRTKGFGWVPVADDVAAVLDQTCPSPT